MKIYKVVFIPNDELCVERTFFVEAETQVGAINEILFRHSVKWFLLVTLVG